MARKNKPNSADELRERLKHEVAGELGLDGEIARKGWAGLSSRQAGRIGGHLMQKLRRLRNNR